jgi:cell fate (sporulation/competence/biofilm development) regulator YlbF (YheA/YmcA/DUF963 family)
MNQELEEWRQELLEEVRTSELEEYRLRTDYDYLLEQADVSSFLEAYNKLKETHEKYGWDFDIDNII